MPKFSDLICFLLCLFLSLPSALGARASSARQNAARSAEARQLLVRAAGEDDLRALATLAQARQLDSSNPEIHFRIGYIYQKMNRRPDSAASYEAALRLSPCHVSALNNLANLRRDANQDARALPLLQKAIRCNPRLVQPYYNLGNLYRDSEQLELAVANYRQALNLAPRHIHARHNLAVVQLNRAERIQQPSDPRRAELLRAALQEFERAARLEATDPLLLANHGRALELLGLRDAALQKYRRALEILPSGGRWRLELGRRIQRLQILDGGQAGDI
ncbi:MAG: tetratricopeptide repeat protein [Leptospirales bacterium]|nr:tetratricopeptide repeat protein [Leptospirales bacterium]